MQLVILKHTQCFVDAFVVVFQHVFLVFKFIFLLFTGSILEIVFQLRFYTGPILHLFIVPYSRQVTYQMPEGDLYLHFELEIDS